MYGKVLTFAAVTILVNTGWTTNIRWVGITSIMVALILAAADIASFLSGIHIP